MKLKKLLSLLAIGAIALTVTACNPQSSGQNDQAISEILTLNDDDHIKGPSDAKVTLIEYSDFQCPACASVYPLVKQLEEAFPNDLKVVYRHFPLQQHYQAIPAARAAEAAGEQGKFFEMHDMLFENQDEWADTPTHKDILFGYAEKLGLHMEKFKEDYESRTNLKRIERDRDDDKILDITGTPTFYLNGEKTSFRSLDQAKALIQNAVEGKSASDGTNAQPL